jgi:hypothetical protein
VLPLPPVISGSLAATGTFAMPFQYQIDASNNPSAYGATGLPSWLTLNPVTGLLSGTATTTGTSNVTISAMNAGGTNSATLTIAIVPPPPGVTTGIANGILYDGATLYGSLTPNGLDTIAYFEFGTTTAYGGATAAQDMGSGGAPVPVTATLTGLMPATTYHYRLDGSNSDGINYGADQTFTTLLPPPTAATGAASAILYNAATLNGVVTPNGLATSAYFQYGTTLSYGNTTASQALGSGTAPVALSGSLAGLQPGTLYHYQVIALNSSGSSAGLDQTFTTVAPPPAATTGPATSVTFNDAILTASINPNGLDTTYWFQFGASTNYTNITPSQDAGSGTSPINVFSSVTGLTALASYHYRIVAMNSSGTVVGADQVFSTPDGQPVAVNDEAYTAGKQSVKINVLANDYDPDGSTLTIVSTTQGKYGAVVMNDDSTLTYIPDSKFKTEDQFTYTISDAHGATSTATVFVHSGFIAAAGNYNGLASGTVPLNDNSGFLSTTVGTEGRYGAQLMFAGLSYRWHSQWDINLQSDVILSRAHQSPLGVTLQLDPGNSRIEGVVTTGSETSDLIAPECLYKGSSNPAPQRGKYTAILTPDVVLSGTSYPAENGSLSIHVAAGGAVTIAGKLGDGTKISASGLIVSGTTCPLYVRLYSGNYPYAGSFFGDLNFDTETNPAACSGTFYWFKPVQKKGKYSSGFGMTVTAQGSR